MTGDDELAYDWVCIGGAVIWPSGCAVVKPACPDGSSGVEGVVPASSDPSSDLFDSSGESESCSATADQEVIAYVRINRCCGRHNVRIQRGDI